MRASNEKQIRLDAGLSLTAAAALAKVSPHTYKTFEVDPDAVSETKRRDCYGALALMQTLKKAS